MAILDEWAARIAREVSPAEAYLAPLWAEAFAQGGRAREEMFRRGGGVVGGFDAAEISSIFPLVLSAVAAAAPLLLNALSSKTATEFVSAVKNGLALAEVRESAAAKRAERQTGEAEEAKSPPAIAIAALPAADQFAPLRRVVQALGQELRAAGMDAEQSDLVTFRVLKVMLDEPQGAGQFVRAVATTP